MTTWLRLAQAALSFPLAMAAFDCSGSADAGNCGERPIFPCAQCGSDWLHPPECHRGTWTCPDHTVFTNTCPDGTCFGTPTSCCGPQGERSAGICHVNESNPAPSGGPCPVGWVSCYTLNDASVGSGGSGGTTSDASIDLDAAVGECLAMDYPCGFCCGKFHYEAMQAFHLALQPCACSSACQSECSDNGFCDEPTIGPSGVCETCLLAQLDPSAACASAVCTSVTCAPYLDCVKSCTP